MSKLHLLLAVSASLAFADARLVAEDAVATSLDAARVNYHNASRKARTKLAQSLERAANTAQRAGNLKLLETIRQEESAFAKSRKLPESVSTDRFEKEMATAQSRMEKAYAAAVTALTKAGEIVRAKKVQGEFDKFLGGKLGPPEDAVVFEGRAYKVFPENLTWEAARLQCNRVGGTLVEIGSEKENQFILKQAQRAKLDSVWLGATDKQTEGEWSWLSGRKSAYTNWGPKQPNNKSDSEHFLLLIVHFNKQPRFVGTWADQPMQALQHKPGYVCQWE